MTQPKLSPPHGIDEKKLARALFEYAMRNTPFAVEKTGNIKEDVVRKQKYEAVHGEVA